MTGGPLIGIDLGGTNCRAAIVSVDGRPGALHRVETRIDEGREIFLNRLEDFCAGLLDEAGKEGVSPSALGLGTPGVIDGEGRVLVSPNLAPLNGVPLAPWLAERLDIPVAVVNDANAIAWGEAVYGAGRDLPSFLLITLGTGVGGGLILERRLWEGRDGAAGEIGHMMVEPEGRPCGCGSRGCLEQYASASGIVKTVLGALAAGKPSLLQSTPSGELTAHLVALAAAEGDGLALAALAEAGRRLGQVLAGLANLLNPDGVVITGGASESLELMRPALEEELARRAFAIAIARLRIVRGELGDDAGIIGAAELARQRLG